MAKKIRKGFRRDQRDSHSRQTTRLNNQTQGPPAPFKDTLELYFKDNRLFKMGDTGVETPLESLGFFSFPSYSWGKSGNVTSGIYLDNEAIPSNTTGRLTPLAKSTVQKVLVSNENSNTFGVTIQEHDGTTFTDLATLNIVATRSGQKDVNIKLTSGKELAAKISSGSCDNPVVSVLIGITL